MKLGIIFLFLSVILHILINSSSEYFRSRVGNILTLILTAVAFKFILASILPKVPYNTLIDYYILYSTFQMAFMTFLSLIPSLFSDEETGSVVNYYIGFIALGLILLGIMVWYFYALYTARKANTFKEVKLVEGKNWFNFKFDTPHFLATESDNVEFLVKCK